MRGASLALLLLVSVTPVLAEQPAAEAQQAFRRGAQARNDDLVARETFRQAAAAYAQAIQVHGETPNLRRMQGQALLLAGDVGGAIYAFRRGLQLDPNDTDLLQGLEYARTRVNYTSPDDAADLAPRPEEFATAGRWLRVWGLPAIALLSVVAWGALAGWVRSRRSRWLVAFGSGLILSLGLSIAWGLERYQRTSDSVPLGVVVRPTVLRCGDGPSFLPRRDTPLPAGVELRLVRQRGDWWQVELADGTFGWLPAASLAAPGSTLAP